MKRIVVGIILIILLSVKCVYAKDDVSLNLSCGSANRMVLGDKLGCDLNLVWENIPVSKISFTVESPFNTSFEPNRKISYTLDDKYLTITPETVLTAKILDSTRLGILYFVADSTFGVGEYNISLKNIKIGNEEVMYDTDDINVTINTVDRSSLDSNCNLNGIIIDGVNLKDFDSNKLQYENIYVNKTMVFVDAIRSSSKSYSTGLGYVRVPDGQTITRVITVTAENGAKKEYKLLITNGQPPLGEVKEDVEVKSNNSKLSLLELVYDKEVLDIHFDSGKTVYYVTLPNDNMNHLTINATLEDEKASFVEPYGPRNVNIDYGTNKIRIRVQAENEEVRTYYVYVTREDHRRGDSSLLSLKVNDKVVLLNGESDLHVSLPGNVTRSKIEVLTNDNNAKVSYKDIDLEYGENTPVIIQVIAENGNKKEYRLTITRLEEVLLENISIVGYDFLFDKNQDTYDLTIKDDITNLDIEVNPNTITSEIMGNENLQDKSVITIRVHEGESIKNYTINIHKEAKVNENNTLVFNILCYSVLIVGILALTLSILHFIKIRKTK